MTMTYKAFWHRYLQAHRHPRTRAVHYAGSTLAIACLAGAAARRDWRLLLGAPVVGYGCAWAAHVGIEGNKPATFGHPLWSLISDYRMLALWVSGRLKPHLEKAGVTAAAS